VFGTIAAGSQRLIKETYSAFLQGTPADLISARYTLTSEHLATYVGASSAVNK
jgi:hypothetical protein